MRECVNSKTVKSSEGRAKIHLIYLSKEELVEVIQVLQWEIAGLKEIITLRQ